MQEGQEEKDKDTEVTDKNSEDETMEPEPYSMENALDKKDRDMRIERQHEDEKQPTKRRRQVKTDAKSVANNEANGPKEPKEAPLAKEEKEEQDEEKEKKAEDEDGAKDCPLCAVCFYNVTKGSGYAT